MKQAKKQSSVRIFQTALSLPNSGCQYPNGGQKLKTKKAANWQLSLFFMRL